MQTAMLGSPTLGSFADVGCRVSTHNHTAAPVLDMHQQSAKPMTQAQQMQVLNVHLKHAIVEDGCLPAPPGVFGRVCQAPDVASSTIALQVKQHNGLHAAGDPHRQPFAIHAFHLQHIAALP